MTTVTKRGAAALLGIACLILGATPSSAEWFGDIYVGASLTDKNDVAVHDRDTGLATYRDVKFDTALAYGLRFGRYLDAVPFLGFGVDYFSFLPNIGPQSVRVDGCPVTGGCGTNKIGFGSYDLTSQAISFDTFLRLPLLKTENAPWGRVTPYILGGPSVFITTLSPRNTRLFRNFDDDTDIAFGYKGGAGLAISVYKNLVVFGEYRFTHVTHSFDIRDINAARATLRTDLDSHTGLVGLGARW
jgi:opacity protein-like surface antigen